VPGVKGKSGGHNRRKVSWNGMDFDSYKSFLKHHRLKSYGSICYYVKYKKLFRDFEILVK